MCTLHHPQLQKKEPLGIAFNFISEIGAFGVERRLSRSTPVRPAVTDVVLAPAALLLSPPGAAETSCPPLTRRLCRSCAALRCPVSNRIYLAAAGCMTGCRRPNEALNTQVRCPGG